MFCVILKKQQQQVISASLYLFPTHHQSENADPEEGELSISSHEDISGFQRQTKLYFICQSVDCFAANTRIEIPTCKSLLLVGQTE